MDTLTGIDRLPNSISEIIRATDAAGGAVVAFGQRDQILLANQEQRRIMPCIDYGENDTYSSLFWAALEKGFTGNPVARKTPHKWLKRAMEVRENSPNLDWVNHYNWGKMLVSHLRLDNGMSIQARLDMRTTGMEHYFLGFEGCLGVTRVLRLRNEIRALEGALDSLGLAVALVDQVGSILHANSSFADMLQAADGLENGLGSRVAAADSCDDLVLRQALTNVAGGILPRMYVPIRRNRQDPLILAISAGSPGTAVVAAARFGEDLDEVEHALRSVLGITPAEAAVVAAVGTGEKITDLSDRRGVSLQTTYHQVNKVKNKFKAARFAAPDLPTIAGLVTGIAAITRAPSKRKH